MLHQKVIGKAGLKCVSHYFARPQSDRIVDLCCRLRWKVRRFFGSLGIPVELYYC